MRRSMQASRPLDGLGVLSLSNGELNPPPKNIRVEKLWWIVIISVREAGGLRLQNGFELVAAATFEEDSALEPC